MKPAMQVTRDALPAKIAQAVRQLMDEHLGATFPAVSLDVRREGETVFAGAWGWADPVTQAHPVTLDTLFDLASISKLFTATLILQLVSEGKLTLDTPLGDVVPAFVANGLRPVDGGQHPFTKSMLPTEAGMAGKMVDPSGVTIRHLLTHTSGLAPWRATYTLHATPSVETVDPAEQRVRWANVVASICASPFVGKPGETVRYSDLGFILLGECVARLTGMPLDAAVRHRIAEPLGLISLVHNPLAKGIERTGIAPTEYDFVWRMRRCVGEVDDENACGMGGVAGHAGLFAAVSDIAVFGEAWRVQDAKLGIDHRVWAEAVRDQVRGGDGERRGLGWKLYSRPDEPEETPLASAPGEGEAGYFGHTGFTGTSLRVDMKRGLTIACLTNRVYYGRDPEGIDVFRAALHTLLAG